MTVAAAIAAGAGSLVRGSCVGPLRTDPLHPSAHEALVDGRLELARRYAPFVYHEFHPTRGRQDVPAPVDFDGNLRGDDNWESFARFELLPTVSYAVLESETHLFFTYHIFHPRDWASFDPGLHLTHENDGENLQVVVDKATERPVLLCAQAHYRGRVYADPRAGFGGGAAPVRGDFLRVDGEGRPSVDGEHACVFVESGGHGIYGLPDRHADVEVGADGSASFGKAGWVLRPAHEGEEVREPGLESGGVHAYRLESTAAKLLPLLLAGEVSGEGRLLDGSVVYAGSTGVFPVPRYYEADRFSGPLGPDRGISPFALDVSFGAGEVGALFFDPARRWAELVAVGGGWSRDLVDPPFARIPPPNDPERKDP